MIRQYDMKFGDAFLLDDDSNNPYLVDFGSTKGISLKSRDIVYRYDKVIADLESFGDNKVNFLLTHFHEDHYIGLLYMMKKRHIEYNFKKIIVPDIRNKFIMTRILYSIFYETMLKLIFLGRKRSKVFTNLYEVSRYFLADISKLKFVSRGDVVDNNQILWPITCYERDLSSITNEYGKIIHELNLTVVNKKYTKKINNEITKCVDVWYEMFISKENFVDSEQFIAFSHLDCLIEELVFIARGKDLNYDVLKEISDYLRKDVHKYNIVFHNMENNKYNYLFTGDISSTNMKKIFNNVGILPSISLHNKYYYIKIPHHGTKTHFFDFTSKLNDSAVLLISSGKSKYKPIYECYYSMYQTYRHICSNCNHCETFKIHNSCLCVKNKIVFPKESLDI